MEYLLEVLLLTFVAGLAIPLGGIISRYLTFKNHLIEVEVNHFIVAFGGGALLSAVALVLVPKGTENLSIFSAILCFGGGGICFMLLDRLLALKGTSASQLIAMLTDFIPEALALGAMFTISRESGLLLALIIFLQNLPEGYNAFKELHKADNHNGNTILLSFVFMSFLGPLSGMVGLFVLAEYIAVLSGIMLFAAGGIIYTTFQDIAPLSRLKYHWAPPLGAVFGFMFGMVGEMVAHG